MRTLLRTLLVVTIGLWLMPAMCHAQNATGTLTVSFTVESSSTIQIQPDGRVVTYVANPPTSGDARPIYFPPQQVALSTKISNGSKKKPANVPKVNR